MDSLAFRESERGFVRAREVEHRPQEVPEEDGPRRALARLEKDPVKQLPEGVRGRVE